MNMNMNASPSYSYLHGTKYCTDSNGQQDYARRVWDHYDSVPSGACMADALSGVLVRCMGYDVSEEICDYGIGHVISSDNRNDDDDDDGFSMARPFGVCSLMLDVRQATMRSSLSTDSTTFAAEDENDNHEIKHATSNSIQVSCISVDPSGSQQHWLATAMGRGSEEGKQLLERRWNKDMSKDEVIQMCADIVHKVSATDETDLEIVCEVLSIDGVERVFVSRNSTTAMVEQ
eukprot:CAMPEP_0116042618 /NCGR_PEP_ID=MMETSP0321-20121206/25810_1 /TAXON_ID=163516 /ORGANISM="Leptocylindrus danicus var. danicus, Strain B650" /LENGTH=231 /DNA_ID=CAMNT_0003523155 /DNA_START=270 /DNA_END=966 /DNA_ORIENTATION=+